MGVLPRRRRRCSCPSAAFALIFLAAAFVTGCAGIGQEVEETRLGPSEHERVLRRERGGVALPVVATRRRLVVGPGSSPPSCRARCGRCFPCRPVRVAIHPAGRIVPQEYYPEAWRCKCGNELFMP